MPQRKKLTCPEISPGPHLVDCQGSNPFGGRRLMIQTNEYKEVLQSESSPDAGDRECESVPNFSVSQSEAALEDEELTELDGQDLDAYIEQDFENGSNNEIIHLNQANHLQDKRKRNNSTEVNRATTKTTNRYSVSDAGGNGACPKSHTIKKRVPDESPLNVTDGCVEICAIKPSSKPLAPRTSFTRTHRRVPSNGNEPEAHSGQSNANRTVHVTEAQKGELRKNRVTHEVEKKRMKCNNDTTKKINGTAQPPSSSDKEHAFDSQKIELLRAFISSRAFTEINNTSQSDHSADSVSQNSRQKANTARLLQNLLTSEVAKKPLKINVNTNAHGDQNSQPTIVTHNKPTHGSQKFLVRKDKQWNNGDGCEPSYIIHIESRTDQSSVCSKPPIETRRRRGDIVRMKRLEIAGEGSLSTPHSRHSESESPHGKRSSEKTQNNDSQFSNDGRQRPNSETDKADHEISLKSSDRRRALSDRKEQGDHRSVNRANFNLRLIDHLERKETSPNNSEPLTLRNDVTAGSVNKVTKIPVVFKESITWISKQASPASGSVGKNLVHAHNGNQSKHSLRSNGDRCPKFDIDISDNFNDNSDTNKMLRSHRPRPSNGLEKENGSNSPKVTNGSRPGHKNDREEGKAYTLPYVSLPWEVMSSVYGKNYEDLLPFVKVTHVRDVACQYSPPSEDDNQEGERVHLANPKCSRTLLNAQQGHHETNISGNAVWSQEREESNYFEEATHNEMTLRASDSDKHRKSIPMESSCSISCKSRHVVSKSETFAKKPSKRKKNHVCRKSEGRIHSEQSKVSCESPESLISCDGERYRPDSPLPSWSGQNYNPNANFSSCEISPYSETGIRRQVWPTGHPSLCSSSEQDTEGLMNPHLNENYSNQRSAQSSDGEPIDEAIVLEPLNPSMLYMPTKDTPSPRYSSHVSQEKLQKLIEEAKANSRASVKILDQNTNFDVDGTYQEKETQDVTNTFIGEYLYKLWKNECLCDVKVTVEDVDFFVHKLVLAAFSNVFCPSTPQPPPSVCFNVPCSTPDAVNQIFNYIYTSSMELKDDLLEPILSAAIFMGISEVIEVINEILMKPTMENLELYIKVKRRHGTYVSLATFPKLYQNHFLELISQDSFLNMTITEFEQILQDPDVLVTSELDTISGIASWVKYNACERSSYLSRLLRCVSFESISPKLLACISEQYSYLFNIPGAPQVISEAFKFHALKLETQCGSYPPTSPCKPTKKQMKGLKTGCLQNSKKKDKLRKAIYYSPNPGTTSCACETFPTDSKQRIAANQSCGKIDYESFGSRKPSAQNLNSSASQNREFNAARYDVFPSNYLRNLPLDASQPSVSHHGKQCTPSGAVMAAPKIPPAVSSKRNDIMKQHPGMVWHSTLNGDRQLWKCTEVPQNERVYSNKLRHLRITPTGRPASKLRKKRSVRHRHSHGFNNNAADFGFIINAAIMEESCAKLEEQLDADVSESYNIESVAGLKSNCTSPRSKEDTETFDTQEISSLETCCNAEKQEILAFPQDASPHSLVTISTKENILPKKGFTGLQSKRLVLIENVNCFLPITSSEDELVGFYDTKQNMNVI
ncbi:uncharacterized protein LOC106072249 [Biomphalaria glabrata]|uniref:Uncharacterized protein LOC106072249 n=1 Tax=Biomphalaria glabrata TaxID=6526 RepID=A0A9W2YJ56_BIOGL|nr:uncharacterized protein LOC106072249 [Biomphalaria glabrata]